MLKKLFVHEWKDTWKLIGFLNLALLCITVLGYFVFSNSMWQRRREVSEYSDLVYVAYFMLFFAVMVALLIISSFYFFIRFYKNLYTDEGYLMHTLPVTPRELIWSKTFVAIIWKIITSIVVIFAFITLFDTMLRGVGEESIWRVIMEGMSILSDEVEFGPRMLLYIILFTVLMIITPFYGLFVGYAAISLGQMTNKHKGMAAVGIYFGINMAIQMIISIFSGVTSVAMSKRPSVIYRTTDQELNAGLAVLAITVVVFGVVTFGFYYISEHTMKRKLNLE